MKRRISLVLILALLATMGLPGVLAEDACEVSVDVDVEVPLADDAGDTGLTIDGAPEEAPQAADPDPGIVEATDEAEPQAGEALLIDTNGEIADGDAAVSAPDEDIVAMAAAGIALSDTSIKIGVDESYTLGVTAPKTSSVPAITWRSDNTKYVTVDKNGKVTGVKKGSANVFAKTTTGQEISCKVTVKKAPNRITVEPEKLKLAAGGMTSQLDVDLPKGTASKKLTFKSDNTKVATVDQNGLVTAVGSGKATITIKTYNRKSCKVKVTVSAAPASIGFPIPELSIAVGQEYKLSPSVKLATGKSAKANVTYAIGANSRDAGCIKLDAATGKVTGVRKGSAVITATTHNGKKATLNVKVSAAPTEIILTEHSVTIGEKDVYSGLLPHLTAPNGETECASTVVWKSSNKKVAKVDANGVITGVGKGSCKITATTANGLKDTCKVTVYKRPKKVSLKPTSASLKVGGTGQFKVVFPKKTCSVVTFSSSNEKVATVDDNGVVTAVSAGEVVITVTTYNKKTAKAKLVVKSSDVSLPDDAYDAPDPDHDVYSSNMTNAQKIGFIIRKAKSQKGKPYKSRSGYTTDDNPSGFDCSGLVYWSFRQAKIKLKATAYKQGNDSTYQKITSISQLQPGDVVCFHTNSSSSKINHTGIYLGNGKFIHASSSAKKVIESTLASGYYKRVFSCGRRILN